MRLNVEKVEDEVVGKKMADVVGKNGDVVGGSVAVNEGRKPAKWAEAV